MSAEFRQPSCPKCENGDKKQMSFGYVGQDSRIYIEMVRCSVCGAIWQQVSDKKSGDVKLVEVTQKVK